MTARYPQSTPDTLYIAGDEIDMADLLQNCMRHFKGASINDLIVSQQNIQIDHFGYDLYDSVDWMQYFVIMKK